MFGLDYTTAVVIGTVCVVSYTLFGGFLAVSWTDLVQGLLMAAALLIVPIIVMQVDGGWGAMFSSLRDINPELLTIARDTDGETLGLISIISLAAWGLGYFGQPHILARFKASRSNEEIPTARRIAVIWSGLAMAGAVSLAATKWRGAHSGPSRSGGGHWAAACDGSWLDSIASRHHRLCIS